MQTNTSSSTASYSLKGKYTSHYCSQETEVPSRTLAEISWKKRGCFQIIGDSDIQRLHWLASHTNLIPFSPMLYLVYPEVEDILIIFQATSLVPRSHPPQPEGITSLPELILRGSAKCYQSWFTVAAPSPKFLLWLISETLGTRGQDSDEPFQARKGEPKSDERTVVHPRHRHPRLRLRKLWWKNSCRDLL